MKKLNSRNIKYILHKTRIREPSKYTNRLSISIIILSYLVKFSAARRNIQELFRTLNDRDVQ